MKERALLPASFPGIADTGHASQRAAEFVRRALGELPYGPGETLRHVLGSARGGGYEWQTNSEPVRNGITALELDGDSTITRLTAVWDASRMSDAAMRWLTTLSIED